MIHKGVSLVGQYHLDRGSDVCQDSHYIVELGDDAIVIAVADGVGSESHSEIGSSVAAKASAEYVKKFYERIDNKLDLLENAFDMALLSVEGESCDRKIPMGQMDCTLCVVIFDKGKVHIGNIGDSGAIGLRTDGRYVPLCLQQNDDEGRVYPLRSKSRWDFQTIDGEFVSVLAATDGFFNYLHPIYLRRSEFYKEDDPSTHIDYLRIREYIDTDIIGGMGGEEYGKRVEELISKIPRVGTVDGIEDDLTVVCAIGSKSHDPCPDYASPFDRKELVMKQKEYVQKQLYGSKVRQVPPTTDSKSEQTDSSTQQDVQSSQTIVDNAVEPKLLENANSLLSKKVSRNWSKYVVEISVDKGGKGHKIRESKPFDFKTLTSLLDADKLKPRRRLEIAKAIVKAVDCVHQEGYLTSVISPESILVNNQSDVKLRNPEYFTDPAENIIITNPQGDSHLYSCREILSHTRGSSDKVIIDFIEDGQSGFADAFSLGVVLYKLLSGGKHPFSAGSHGIVENIIANESVITFGELDRRFLTPELESAFERVLLRKDDMPDTEEWGAILDHYSAGLHRCGRDGDHFYPDCFQNCPYCPSDVQQSEKGRKRPGGGLGKLLGTPIQEITGLRSKISTLSSSVSQKGEQDETDQPMFRQEPVETKEKPQFVSADMNEADPNKKADHQEAKQKSVKIQIKDGEEKPAQSNQNGDDVAMSDQKYADMIISKRPSDVVLKFSRWPISYSTTSSGLEFQRSNVDYQSTLKDLYEDLDNQPITRRATIARNLAKMVRFYEMSGCCPGNIEPSQIGIVGDCGVVFLLGDPLSISFKDVEPFETKPPEDKRFVRPFRFIGDKMTFTFEDVDYMLAQHISWLILGNSNCPDSSQCGAFYIQPDMDLNSWFPELRGMFIDVVDGGSIPSGEQWFIAIQRYFKQLVKCDKIPTHYYSVDSPVCPYCKTGRSK